MLNLVQPLSRWEALRIFCDSIETRTDRPDTTETVIAHYDSSFHMVFNTLKAKHPCLEQICIEGIHLKPLEEFYVLDIILYIQGRCLYLSIPEVAYLSGTAGLPYVH